MGRTVRQISEELNLSKQAIYQRINAIKDFKEKYTKKVGNHIVINDDGYNELNKELNQSNKNINQLVDETNNVIFKELRIKNEQLRAKDKQIANLQKALDQEQQLHLTADNRVSNLESRLKILDKQNKSNESNFTNSVDESMDQPKQEESKKKVKKGFWSNIFKG